MGSALAANNADEVRVLIGPMLAVLLGPPLLPIWVAGLVGLVRRPDWRDQRWIAVTFVVVVAFTFVGGAQVHYLMATLPVLYAAGCVPVASWVSGRPGRVRLVWAGVAANAVVSLVIALPLVPVDRLGDTPVTAMNPVVGDTVGWERYAAQIAEVQRSAGPGTPVIATNYGEAGALVRFGVPDAGSVLSGQNALWDAGPPPATSSVVVVGAQLARLEPLFAACEVRAHLDNGVSVDNEEQGQPVAVCHDPIDSWHLLWQRVRHLD
jgi:hypothetical protein